VKLSRVSNSKYRAKVGRSCQPDQPPGKRYLDTVNTLKALAGIISSVPRKRVPTMVNNSYLAASY
jgi:hypothetical protein